MKHSRFFLIIAAIMLGVASRLLPHLSNCTAMNAIALFSTYSLGGMWTALAVVLGTLFLSDMVIGFHATLPFVYLSLALVVMMGRIVHPSSFGRLWMLGVFSSILFFLITNFGVWAVCSLYPKTLYGLGICYLNALPFLQNQFLGDFAYIAMFYALMKSLKLRANSGHFFSISLSSDRTMAS